MPINGCELERQLERAIGNLSATIVEGYFGVINDPLLNVKLARIGKQIVRASGRENVPYDFRILRSDDVNALAVPFGNVYVFRGLLNFVDSEDELAAVIAHEVAHVARKHAVKSVERSLLANLLIQLALKDKRTAREIAGIAYQLLELRYSRDNEREADYRALQYMVRNGYDPHGLERFFEQLNASSKHRRPCKLEVYLSTHPPTSERLERVRRIASDPERLKLNMSEAQIYSLRGDAYLNRGMYRNAIVAYQRAMVADANCISALLGLGRAYATLGLYENARKAYQRALQLEPSNEVAKRSLRELRLRHSEAHNRRNDGEGKAHDDATHPSVLNARITNRGASQRIVQLREELMAVKASIKRECNRMLSTSEKSLGNLRDAVNHLKLVYERYVTLPEREADPLLEATRRDALAQLSVALNSLNNALMTWQATVQDMNDSQIELESAVRELYNIVDAVQTVAQRLLTMNAVTHAQRGLKELQVMIDETSQLQADLLDAHQQLVSVIQGTASDFEWAVRMHQLMKRMERKRKQIGQPTATERKLPYLQSPAPPIMVRGRLRRSKLFALRHRMELLRARMERVYRMAQFVKLRTIAVKLDVMGLRDATPSNAIARMLAYHLEADANDLNRWLQRTGSYADAAILVGAAVCTGRNPANWHAEAIATSGDIIDCLRKAGVDVFGLATALKFALSAWERELDATIASVKAWSL